MKNFQGKVVWITGASSGIGAELSKQCAEAGADVFVAGSAVFAVAEPAAMVDQLRSLAVTACAHP
jgi:ribulose-phosphate 3-epimerase